MTIDTLCVCGAGTMGSGIAQAAAQAGIHTLVYDLDLSILNRARTQTEKSLATLVERSRMTNEQATAIRSRLQYTNELQECLADVFIEAVVERPEVKIALFNQLAEINHGESVFATNTSSLSITALAQHVQGRERVIGMHFFNPATVMKLVEVVTTPYTSPETTETILELARRMQKEAVLCRDAPGFIVNRVARPYYIESLRITEEGQVPFEQTDTILEASGFRLGPFRLMDLIGNDVNYAVSCSVYEQLGRPERLRPSAIQEDKVSAGALGRKTGTGYYSYSPSDSPPKPGGNK